MYLKFYGLNEKPFEISTNSKFLWLGEKHREALSMLKYGILEDKGFLLLTGDVGTGKTTLINALISSFGSDTIVANVPDPGLAPIEFYNYVAAAFKMNRVFNNKGTFLVHFNHFLHQAYTNKKKVLLIVDEAQRLSPEMLEEIRLLSNIEKEETKLLNIFFIGQNEFNRSLLKNENRALRQRITLNYHIEPLSKEEVDKYLMYRLKIAGQEERLFTPEAVANIHYYTDGFPRLINILSDLALLTGFVRETKEIGPEIIHSCADQLRIEEPAIEELEEEETVAPVILDDSAPPENASVVGGLSDDPSVPERVNFFEAKDFQIRNVAFISLILMVFFIILLYFPDLYQKYEKLFRNARISDVTVQDQVTPSPPLSGQNSKGNDVGFSPKETAENTGLETLNPESETADNSKTIALPIDPKTIQEEEITTKLGGSMPKMAADQGASQSGDLKAETDPSKSAAALIKPLPPLPEEPLRVYFNHNSNELDPGAYEDLANLADHMKQKPEMKVEITGYTDSAGGSSYNKWLSEFRANIVKIFLVGKGINPSRLNAVGKGQENPIASNETAEGRRKNRRVEIILVTLPVPLS